MRREVLEEMMYNTTYQYLELRPGSNYRQLFVRGRSLRAEVLYRATLGPELRASEEIADDFDVPRDAVYEAIHYSRHHEDLLRQERDEVLAAFQARGLDQSPLVPTTNAARA